MCFPSKKQGQNLADDQPTQSKSAPTTATNTNAASASAPVQSTQPVESTQPQTSLSATAPAAAPIVSSTAATETTMSSPKVAIVIYTMYGHIGKPPRLHQLPRPSRVELSRPAGRQPSTSAFSGNPLPSTDSDVVGGHCRIAETLPQEVLTKMHAPAKPDYPIFAPADLPKFDAFIFGVPTRYGNFPAQWKAFWDATGGLWMSGALYGKSAGLFISTASLGGGQESTAIAMMSTLAHHGISFVPLGYKNTFAQLTNLDEAHGGSPWGAGTFAGSDSLRKPSALELEIATIQGKTFWEHVSRIKY
ncbi:hypothetical protein EW146_g3802 [Bondarzewia mesenterica]|uniref:NADPH-dependent FMN reductase-like domain-containing protein n=1 Tax=Bondarzewia mesenterica TaxID=1095465 RepID=A0A4S4LYB7_9AGAM|nr:hypothetical protein EW146_g3802 [Bondarzewia mesenterica]